MSEIMNNTAGLIIRRKWCNECVGDGRDAGWEYRSGVDFICGRCKTCGGECVARAAPQQLGIYNAENWGHTND